MVTKANEGSTHRWTVVMLVLRRGTGRGAPGTMRCFRVWLSGQFTQVPSSALAGSSAQSDDVGVDVVAVDALLEDTGDGLGGEITPRTARNSVLCRLGWPG